MKVDWSGDTYADVSAVQKWLADESLSSLTIGPAESILDAGCGDGRITAELARHTTGTVLGFDASPHMISHAREHHRLPNLSFQEAEAQAFETDTPFQRLVSFNALHWIKQEELGEALANLARCLNVGGQAHIRLVGLGERQSLEAVVEETCLLPEWREYFPNFHTRFCHPTVEQLEQWATSAGFRTDSADLSLKSWDFQTEEAFHRWADTTFVAWTSSVPESQRASFITQVLSRYEGTPVFRFYQLVANLTKET